MRLLQLPQVKERRGQQTTGVYDDVKKGRLTPPIKRGRSSFWPDHEVDAITAAEIAGATEDEIKALVRQLVKARASMMPRIEAA
jgi:prophage regulatory protein